MAATVEQLVWTRSEDDLELAGLAFRPRDGAPRMPGDLAVVLVHGVGGTFYSHLSVGVGRALAALGLPAVAGNNRGHDVGAFLIRPDHGRVLGGAAWEDVGEAPRDLSAWVGFALEHFGVGRVLLAGHSLGGLKVARYLAQRRDPRVAAMALLSPAGGSSRRRLPPQLAAEVAERLAQGREEELLAMPGHPIGRMSARALAAREALAGGDDLTDLVARAACPTFACYGTVSDIGGQPELDRMAAAGAVTRLFPGADHGYLDLWTELAQAVAAFATTLPAV